MITGYTSARVLRVAVLAALVVLAFIFSWWREHTVAPVLESRLTRWRGTVLDARGGDAGTRTYTFAIDGGPLALVSLPDQVSSGTLAIVRGRLEPLDSVRNPGETSERTIEGEHGIGARIEHATLLAATRSRQLLAREACATSRKRTR